MSEKAKKEVDIILNVGKDSIANEGKFWRLVSSFSCILVMSPSGNTEDQNIKKKPQWIDPEPGEDEPPGKKADISTEQTDDLDGPTHIPQRRSTLHEKAKSEGINPLGLLIVAVVMVNYRYKTI